MRSGTMSLKILHIGFFICTVIGHSATQATLTPASLRFEVRDGKMVGAGQRLMIDFTERDAANRFNITTSHPWITVTGGPGRPDTPTIDRWSVTVSVRPDLISAAGVIGEITVTVSNGHRATTKVEAFLTSSPPPTGPVIAAVTSAAWRGLSGLAPGSLATIYGERLAAQTRAFAPPLPLATGEVEVALCQLGQCTRQELIFVSPAQINFRVLYSYIEGNAATLRVTRSGESTTHSVSLEWIAPGIFFAAHDCPVTATPACVISTSPLPSHTTPRGTVTDSIYQLVTSTSPTRPGGVYTLWVTGLGSPGVVGDLRMRLGTLRIPLGLSPPSQSLLSIADAEMLWASASSEFPGLYQINIRLPAALEQSAACANGRAALWLTFFGATLSAGIPIPLDCTPPQEPVPQNP